MSNHRDNSDSAIKAAALQLVATKCLQEKEGGSLEAGIGAFQKALKMNPESSLDIFDKSAKQFSQKNFSACATACDEELEALEARREEVLKLKQLFVANVNKAKKESSEAMKGAIRVFKNQIRSLLPQKKWSELVEVYEMWMAMQPTNPEVKYYLAEVYKRMQDYEKGLDYCNEGIKLCEKIEVVNNALAAEDDFEGGSGDMGSRSSSSASGPTSPTSPSSASASNREIAEILKKLEKCKKEIEEKISSKNAKNGKKK